MDGHNMDSLWELHKLVHKIFTDPSWRGNRLDNNIEIEMNSVLEKLSIEERFYKNTIRKQEDLIKKLATTLDNCEKAGGLLS